MHSNNEIEVESYFRAGTSRAADFRADAADAAIGCAACGRLIVKCFVLSDGRIVGGDCAATITGDDSTRERGEALFALAARKPDSLEIDGIAFAEEVYRVRKARHDTKDLASAFAAYRAMPRTNAREALGVKTRKAIFDAVLAAKLA